MFKTVTSMLAKAGNVEHPYLQGGQSKNVGIVVITSNRGLAGGYNSNIAKMVQTCGVAKENVRLYAVGKKGMDMLLRKGYELAGNYSDMIEEPTFEDAKQLSTRLLEDFTKGEIGEIYVAYTEFKNTVTHIPKLVKLLPVEAGDLQEEEEMSAIDKITPMNFEPSEEEAIALLADLGLGERLSHKPSELSGGEQQRVAIARALINHPAVLFADEPSGNLDSKTKTELHRLFFELRDRYQQTIVIVTHDPELAQMCDRSLFMVDGQFV